MLGGELSVLQAPMFDGVLLDPFALFDDGRSPAEVGIGAHSLRRTKASLIYKATGNLRPVQILLGHTNIENLSAGGNPIHAGRGIAGDSLCWVEVLRVAAWPIQLLELEGEARSNEENFAGGRGDRLVEAAGFVPEAATERIVWYKSKSDLIGDQDDSAASLTERLGKGVRGSHDVAFGMHEIAEPQSEAIDQQHPAVALFPDDRLG
jgi:hypothetical protein